PRRPPRLGRPPRSPLRRPRHALYRARDRVPEPPLASRALRPLAPKRRIERQRRPEPPTPRRVIRRLTRCAVGARPPLRHPAAPPLHRPAWLSAAVRTVQSVAWSARPRGVSRS